MVRGVRWVAWWTLPWTSWLSAFDQAGRALDTVSADNLDNPTPCSDWTVRQHRWPRRVGSGRVGEDDARGGGRLERDPRGAGRRVGGDLPGRCRRAARRDAAGCPRTSRASAGFQVAEYAVHAWDLVRGTGRGPPARRLARRDRARRDAGRPDRREPPGCLRDRGGRCRRVRARTSGWPPSRGGILTPDVGPRESTEGLDTPARWRFAGFSTGETKRRHSHRSAISTAIAAATPRPMSHEMSRSGGGGKSWVQLLRRRSIRGQARGRPPG